MSLSAEMKGARLEFVVRELRGQVEHVKCSWDPKKKKIVHVKTKQDAGYMLYLPNGSSYRLSSTQLVERGFDRQPNIINLDAVKSTDSPAGRFKFAITDQARAKAWAELEKAVIDNCIRRKGIVEKETIDGQKAA